MSEDEFGFEDRDRWGDEPTLDPPEGTTWAGEWQCAIEWHTDLPMDHPGYPIWSREYLVYDGHEECCHHTRHVTVLPDGQEVPQ